jgi:RNA polymerase subunit RPABC4/transcription elongation factor Spt4
MTPEFRLPAKCPVCRSAAFDLVWIDRTTGDPAKRVECPTCTVPPTADPWPALMGDLSDEEEDIKDIEPFDWIEDD